MWPHLGFIVWISKCGIDQLSYSASLNVVLLSQAISACSNCVMCEMVQATREVRMTLQVNSEDAYVVLNAGCRDKDIEHIQGQLKKFQV